MDLVSITVADLSASAAFYEAASDPDGRGDGEPGQSSTFRVTYLCGTALLLDEQEHPRVVEARVAAPA